MLDEHLIQRRAIQPFERDEGTPTVLVYLEAEEPHDVSMPQARGERKLAVEQRVCVGIFGKLFRQRLQRNPRFRIAELLSQQISRDFAAFLQAADVPVEPLPFATAASLVLVLAPALIMLFSGPKYTDQRYAIAGSVLFAVFGTVLLLPSLVPSLPFDDKAAVQPLLSTIALNSPLIISTAVIVAVFDMMHAQGKSPLSKKSKH